MPAVGLGKVSMPQDTICRGRLRQVDTPLFGNSPDSKRMDSPMISTCSYNSYRQDRSLLFDNGNHQFLKNRSV